MRQHVHTGHCDIKLRSGWMLPRISGENSWRETDSINQSPRFYPSRASIRAYWAPVLWKKPWCKFDSIKECLEADYCFACGRLWPTRTDRAHILARIYGGSDNLSNLHLLCLLCHELSEHLCGVEYWRWFKRQGYKQAVEWGAYQALTRICGDDMPATIPLDQGIKLFVPVFADQ